MESSINRLGLICSCGLFLSLFCYAGSFYLTLNSKGTEKTFWLLVSMFCIIMSIVWSLSIAYLIKVVEYNHKNITTEYCQEEKKERHDKIFVEDLGN